MDGAGEALRILVNEASKIERSQHLHAQPYERSDDRRDHANGFMPKTVKTRIDQREPIGRRIRALFNAPDPAETRRLLEQALELWRKEAPRLVPSEPRRRCQRASQSSTILKVIACACSRPTDWSVSIAILKRRTRVASIFPNSASCLRLISALLAEFDEGWMTGKIYLAFKS